MADRIERDVPGQRTPHYTVRPVSTPLPSKKPSRANGAAADAPAARDPFVRAEAEDDDGYDPYSDRPPAPEETFQEDPWR